MSAKTPRFSVAPALSAFCLLTVLLAPRATALQAAEDRVAPKQEFQALLERVKKSDASVDFARMTRLQTQLNDYKPYGDVEGHPFTLLNEGHIEAAQLLVDRMLAQNYLDLEAQFAAAQIADKRKDAAAAAHHRYVFQGVLDSILKSGDGKSPETAYVVVALSEEYAARAIAGSNRIALRKRSHDMRTLWSWLGLMVLALSLTPDENPGDPSADGAWQIDPLG